MHSPVDSDFPNPPTIGMLTAWLSGPTEINLWHGVADQAQVRNINLICFSGGIPHWQQQDEAQKNILFNIAGKDNVDGLLIWANILSHTLDRSSMEAFCQPYAPLPMISMGMFLPSIPSIRIDMKAGMHKLLSHLIEKHGRRRIAFIRGLEVSQDAEDRYQAYLETLSQFGLDFDPDLIVLGDFQRVSGVVAIQQLLDGQRKNFDAVVSANDNMAIGALQALQSRGVQIPNDVIVAGFDDIEETRAVAPSLTTVRAPWHRLGSNSLDLILSKLAGDELPEQILLQTELVCRQSCGCQPAVIKNNQDDFSINSNPPEKLQSFSISRSAPLQSELFRQLEDGFTAKASALGLNADWSHKLVNEFLIAVMSKNENSGSFVNTLTSTLGEITSGAQILEWQEPLDGIRKNLVHLFRSKSEIIRAHELLENGYAVIGEIAHRRQLSQRLESESLMDRLNTIVQTMSTTYELEMLMKLLASELPRLGIRSCFLSLYDEKGDNPAASRIILACEGQERSPLAPGGIRFVTNRLVPEGMLPKNRTYAYDVEALYFHQEQIGFVLFEIGPRDGEVYKALRGHLSSALKSAELVHAALTAEAKAVKADQLKTHLLANVSHELRTPINIILGLSQIALSTPNPYDIQLPDRLAKDLEHIAESGEHLVRLINDLLDMSRAEIGELDLYFEPVSPRSLLKETFETFKIISLNKQKNVELKLDLPEHLPILNADPVRLRQILMNLLSNALKFTQRGEIILGAEIQLPHIHIWVADTGPGIPVELQERIFEPFVKAGPPGQRKGGIGLGLSITRRLTALHSGSITLDSQPGHGSTFHIYIPLPGVNTSSARLINPEGAQPILLWISSSKTPAQAILNLCQKSGLIPCWLSHLEELDSILQEGKPAALAWDLDHVRPGDWSIIQKLRGLPQFFQLPLLLFQENIAGEIGGSRLTNVILKPSGKQTLQHVLDLLPQTLERGEIWIIDDDRQAVKYYHDLISQALSEFVVRGFLSGEDALRLLTEITPDLVMLDLVMPEVDGFQVLEQLRRNTKTALIPVIILTGKMLSYEDVKRLDFPRVALHTKGVLSDLESVAEVERLLTTANMLPQPTSKLIKQALSYIQQNYPRSFSLKELCETIGVSRSYLSRIFKIETGLPLWHYLNRFRIQKAKELLLLTSESITEIAADVGFEDVGYFGRVFREVAGCSPRAFKKQTRTAPLGDSTGQ